MSDDKQLPEEELEMQFDDAEDLFEEDFLEADDSNLFEDLDGMFDEGQEEAVKPEGNANFWLVLGICLFLLTIVFRNFMFQIFDLHNDSVQDSAVVSNQINLSDSSATRALDVNGDHGEWQENFSSLELSVNNISDSNGLYEAAADRLFGDQEVKQNILTAWEAYKEAATGFAAQEENIVQAKAAVAGAAAQISDSVNETNSFVDAVAKEGRSKGSDTAKNRYLFLTSEAANINGVLNRLSSGMQGYYLPSINLQELSDKQNTLVVRLKDTISRITGNAAAVVATAAEPLSARVESIETQLLDVGDKSQALTQARSSLGLMQSNGETLKSALARMSDNNSWVRTVEIVFNWSSLVFLLGSLYAIFRYFRMQSRGLVESESSLSNALADQQESILKLLDEMSSLADGDLTVQAEVTDQITGAIADSVNFAVIEMRELVSQINRASVQVANESEMAVSNAKAVSESNTTQAEQVSFAATEMQRITESMRLMSEQALSSSEMASESLRVATQGSQAVRDTIASMDDMREQIQDTSKRIKRLGESSQRIGDIVALIDDIAEQTNILSLNAAIQASMAGEAGRGFAVVSDEVQSLAERSTEATKKIAELVTTIQNDTNDAVASMEQATQQVVSGTKIADTAGSALAEIERASNGLSDLVEKISAQATNQAKIVTDVAEKVTVVSESSTETSAKAQESANSIAKLLELAKELETSVSRFKLPAS